MSITGAIILFAVIWFICFFVALQIRPDSQAEAGKIVPGTPPGAPANLKLKRKVIWTTMIAIVLWAAITGVVLSGAVTLHDIDWFGRLAPVPPAGQ